MREKKVEGVRGAPNGESSAMERSGRGTHKKNAGKIVRGHTGKTLPQVAKREKIKKLVKKGKIEWVQIGGQKKRRGDDEGTRKERFESSGRFQREPHKRSFEK